MSIFNKKDRSAAQVVCQDVVQIKKGERVLIVANPATTEIAQDLYQASLECGALTTLTFQPDRTSFDNANPEVLAAIGAGPDVCFSISNVKLGKDPEATAKPYKTDDGQEFTHIFDYLMDGKKTMRGVWTPGITPDMMERTAPIDYKELQDRCKTLGKIFEGASSVHVTAPGGTDLTIPVEGRGLMFDDGDFSKPGTGGNIPAGEVFISPVVGSGNADGIAADIRNYVPGLMPLVQAVKDVAPESETAPAHTGCQGTIVYDGSMTFADGDSILETPITCKVLDGFVTEISGGDEAKHLMKTISETEVRALLLEKEGKLPAGQGQIYKRNARNIGELGIGLNPAARITGNMLEDEKAFHTCHFAIGENYDNDAPSLIHLDGVVREPTITVHYPDGGEKVILEEGELKI